MTTFFFDTYALIAIAENDSAYEHYKDAQILTTNMNLAELYYHCLQTIGEKRAQQVYYKFAPAIIPITARALFLAMNFKLAHKKQKLSYVDCIGYATAIHNNVQFLTGDKEFENIPHVEFVKATH